jgi:phage terminase large subunit GpA-like protein
LNFESWYIDRRMIIGSPEKEKTWRELDEYLAQPWPHEDGITLLPWSTHGLNCVCVDSGFSAQNVYAYVKPRQSRRFYATKGDEGFKKPFIINVTYEKRMHARLAIIAVDALKVRVYDRLTVKEAGVQGYMHFNTNCNEDYFKQLTAEKLVTEKTRSGFPRRVWKLKENHRNEVLDCTVMNVAAIELLRPNFEKLRAKLSEVVNAKADRDQVRAKDNIDTPDNPSPSTPNKPGRKRLRFKLK